MKSLFQLSTCFSATEKLGKDQKIALKGGDDKRPPRPPGDGGNPQPNGNYQNDNNWN